MKAYQKGFTTPYWWFADIGESWKYIKDIEGSIQNSTISHDDKWSENFKRGMRHFYNKFGAAPTRVPDVNPELVKQNLNYLFHNR